MGAVPQDSLGGGKDPMLDHLPTNLREGSVKKHLREAIRIASNAGLTVIEARRGKHYVLKCVNPFGEKRTLTIPCTPGDTMRGMANFKSQARRAAI